MIPHRPRAARRRVRESSTTSGHLGGSPVDKKAKTPKKPKQIKSKDKAK
jgi:hypothetical protein